MLCTVLIQWAREQQDLISNLRKWHKQFWSISFVLNEASYRKTIRREGTYCVHTFILGKKGVSSNLAIVIDHLTFKTKHHPLKTYLQVMHWSHSFKFLSHLKNSQNGNISQTNTGKYHQSNLAVGRLFGWLNVLLMQTKYKLTSNVSS